jgi:hypothetical protein
MVFSDTGRCLFLLTIIVLLSVIISPIAPAQAQARTEVEIPDIPGYYTLKCDFHVHTVYSDGEVWPSVRPQEAWLEGLDAIALTDHVESVYQPHINELPKNLNKPYELAMRNARAVNLLLIKGGEITRHMPPGHYNALFLDDVDPLDTPNYKDALKAAVDQGAFIVWNHPGWRQPDEIPVWHDEHTELFELGWMHGMEIVNEDAYYPLAHKWCLEKKITMLGCSDIHDPIHLFYDPDNGFHRPMTLVFAKERSLEAVKEALFARRTAVYWRNFLIGEEQYLQPIFEGSIQVLNPEIELVGRGWGHVRIKNNSDVTFELVGGGQVPGLTVPSSVKLHAHKTVIFPVRSAAEAQVGIQEVSIPYMVRNLLVAPETGLPVEIKLRVDFKQAAQ